MPLVALTRAVPPSIDRCELTHLAREPIDYAGAVREHASYEDTLRRLGCRVERLPALPEHPDSVFVEDTAVIIDGIAVVTRPGAPSRRGEVPSTAEALSRFRQLAYIRPPGTLDGGDVIVTPDILFVGISGRTNADGARQLATIVAPLGIRLVTVPVARCLHLKSAAVWLPPTPAATNAAGAVLLNPEAVDPAVFAGFDLIEIDPSEPAAANVLAVGDRVMSPVAHSGTRRRLEANGYATLTVPAGELAKAEGGVTCCSIVLRV